MRVVYAFFPVPNGRVKLWSWASACVEYKSLSCAQSSWDSQGTVPVSLHNSENPSVPDTPWFEARPSWVVRAFYSGEDDLWWVEHILFPLWAVQTLDKYSKAWALPSLCTCLRSLGELTDLRNELLLQVGLRAGMESILSVCSQMVRKGSSFGRTPFIFSYSGCWPFQSHMAWVSICSMCNLNRLPGLLPFCRLWGVWLQKRGVACRAGGHESCPWPPAS